MSLRSKSTISTSFNISLPFRIDTFSFLVSGTFKFLYSYEKTKKNNVSDGAD